jgi:hypothetical protein
LAAFTGTFDWRIGMLAALTASLLQIEMVAKRLVDLKRGKESDVR